MFEKRAYFAIALADQRDYGDVGGIVARHGAEQSAFANAAAAEDAHALSCAARNHGVDGADAGDDGADDVFAIEGAAGSLVQAIVIHGANGSATIDGAAETVEHAAHQVRSDGDLRVVTASHDAIVQLNPVDLLERHGEHMAIAESDDLRADAASGSGLHLAEISDCGCRPARGDQHSHQFDHFARPGKQLIVAHIGDVGVQVDGLRRTHACISSWSARPRSISASCVSTEASNAPRRNLKHRAALGLERIADHGHGLPTAGLLQTGFERTFLFGVNAHAVDFLSL